MEEYKLIEKLIKELELLEIENKKLKKQIEEVKKEQFEDYDEDYSGHWLFGKEV